MHNERTTGNRHYTPLPPAGTPPACYIPVHEGKRDMEGASHHLIMYVLIYCNCCSYVLPVPTTTKPETNETKTVGEGLLQQS